jgi:hypothetical protein
MARINFDIAKRLDITARLGDSFQLELTLKDSSGIPINLHGQADAANAYEFKMKIRKPQPGSVTGGTIFAEVGYLGTSKITVTLTDDANSTTADTSDASYVASTAATGKVTFSISAEDMVSSTGNLSGYLYDIQYVDPVNKIPLLGEFGTEKTILHGNFNFIDDISYRFS